MLGSLLPRRRASEELPRPLFPPAVNPVSAVWQWQSEAGWHCFDPVQCEALETARASGNTRLTLRSGKWMYNIDLGNMLQQNVMTRRMRHVRRIMEEVPLWFREGADAEEAVRYDPELEAALESSYAALVEQLGNDPPGEAAVSLTVWTGSDGLDYEADVEEMTECCRSTGVVRKICRSVLRVRPSVGESDAPDGCEAETAFQLPSLAVGTAESGECWCRGHLRVVGANDLDDVLIPVAASEAVEDVCAICLDSLGSTSSPGDSSAPMRGTLDHASAPQSEAADGVVKLKKCMHMYHDTCVRTYVGRGGRGGFSCPTCGTLQCAGNGPSPKGRMRWRIGEESLLAGYPHSGTISIEYDVPSGIQSERHQHPAVPFMGTKRTAYLPDTREGREVLILFIHAFVKVSSDVVSARCIAKL
ncbi:wwe domain-containing protein [Cystoisospora suis]|uniref:RING-type E3 ubiquitin transferase n=1 Tax=Cystoisospora suis TaxID=483139 RepID=A0A2C6L0E7_9APIC|nr:wwe domain-containing protein [Cystoisospora suis]